MKAFSKGDVLISYLYDDSVIHLLVVHVLVQNKIFYCWDRTNKTYRLIYNHPRLHLLCPDFDPDFPSDIDWENQWMVEMYTRGYEMTEKAKHDMHVHACEHEKTLKIATIPSSSVS